MADWCCTIGGQQHGPVTFETLQSWAQAGSLRGGDYVWSAGMANWVAASSVPNLIPANIPPAAAAPSVYAPAAPQQRYLQPHRGAAVLTLGILGLVACLICGIIAWVMGNNDLREMRAGRMDRSGEGMTNAGRICGMIACILAMAGAGIYLIFLVVMLLVAAAH